MGLKHEHWKEKDAETFFGKELSQKQLRAKREVKPLPYMRRTTQLLLVCIYLQCKAHSSFRVSACVKTVRVSSTAKRALAKGSGECRLRKAEACRDDCQA